MLIESIPKRYWFKSRVLVYLSRRAELAQQRKANHLAWVSVPDIVRATGVGSGSARVILNRWSKASWGYAAAYQFTDEQTSDERPHTFYRLNDKGRKYLAKLPKWYGYYNEAVATVDQLGVKDRLITPKPVWFPAAPNAQYNGVILRWPFNSSGDAGIYEGMAYAFYLKTDGFETAVEVVRSVYGTRLSPAYQKYVLSLYERVARAAGYRLRVGTR